MSVEGVERLTCMVWREAGYVELISRLFSFIEHCVEILKVYSVPLRTASNRQVGYSLTWVKQSSPAKFAFDAEASSESVSRM